MARRPPHDRRRGGRSAPRRRPDAVRIADEAARRVREGHPWIFEGALQGRKLPREPASVFDVLGSGGEFLGRAVFDPGGGPLVLRVFSRRRGAVLDAEAIATTVRAAARRRRGQLDVAPDGCLRLVNGDSEGLPAVNVDRYADYLVICGYSPLVEKLLEPLVASLVDTWKPRGIYVQRRYQAPAAGRGRPGAELVWGAAAPPEVIVREGRVRYAVDVTAPLGTGLFSDMRCGRAAVARLAGGRRVLNCFSYTGAFSVVAALYGARTVVSVDSAARAHARARRNLQLNSVDERDRIEFVTGDAFAALARYRERATTFDMVILDPPTFSSGARGRAFTALRDYAELAGEALAVLSSGGLLVAASNAAKLSEVDFERALGRGAELAGRTLLLTERIGQPADYPVLPSFSEGRYLKVAIGRVSD